MDKILVIIDPLKRQGNLLDFALYFAEITGSVIAGIVMETTFSEKLVEKDLHGFPVAFAENKIAKNRLAIRAGIEKAISDFEKKCSDRRIPFTVHRDHGFLFDDIVAESRFADFMLIDADVEPDRESEHIPTVFVRDILQKSECPVILAPQHPGEIHEIIFCYDGSLNAMHAIKQFTSLFPVFKDKKVVILEAVRDIKSDMHSEKRLKEWIGNHYTHFQYELRKGTVKQILFDSVFKKENIFIVMGSFGRSALSILFKKATAEPLIKVTTQPVFIAHT